MKVLKLLKKPFSFGGACPTQLFALTLDHKYVYGRLRHGHFCLMVTETPINLKLGDSVRHIKLEHIDVGAIKEIVLFQIEVPELDGICTWQEFKQICLDNGYEIKLYDAIDYMREGKDND